MADLLPHEAMIDLPDGQPLYVAGDIGFAWNDTADDPAAREALLAEIAEAHASSRESSDG